MNPKQTRQILNLVLVGWIGVSMLWAEETATQEAAAGFSDEQIREIVLKHIKTQTAKHGTFWVYDAVENHSYGLELVELLAESCGRTAPETYIGAARFLDDAGKPVVVDIIMRGSDPEDLELLEVTVQEKDGKPRYTWAREAGFWSKEKAAAEP